MTVEELRKVLATLPGDTLLTVRGQHIEYLARIPARSETVVVGYEECGVPGHPHVPVYEDHPTPARLELGTTIRNTPGTGPAPAVRLYGRWSKAAKEALA